MCNYCNVKKYFIETDFDNDAISAYLNHEDKKLVIDYNSLEEMDGTTLSINYCPMCGRKL